MDDEIRLATYIKTGMEAEGFAVDVANDGRDGLWMASENHYDAVILDILLPGINGYAVCAELRKQENWVPIIMLTAKTGEHDEAEALDTGADDYLSKPFSFVVLVARIRALVRRGAPERPTVLVAGDLTLDPSLHAVQAGDREIELTPTEFSVLEYLMLHDNATVSKDEVLSHVWNWEFEGSANIVEVYIGYVRRKLAASGCLTTIETLRGIGYRVRAARPGEPK